MSSNSSLLIHLREELMNLIDAQGDTLLSSEFHHPLTSSIRV